MSVQFPTAFVKQYSDNVTNLVQQKGSRLRDLVRVKTDVKGNESFFDRIGATSAVKKTGRHMTTPHVDTPHSRRRITLVDYVWSDEIDREDEVRALIYPESEYAKNAGWAMGRSFDDEVIAAMRGNAYGGVDGGTAIPLPSGQKIALSATSMTLAKLLEAKQILDASEVDPEIPRYIALSSKEVTSLLNTTEIKDADYNTVKALALGQINSFLGFNFIRTERLPDNGSTERYCLAWAQDGVGLAIGADVISRIDVLPTHCYSTQVFLAMTIGATRVEEEKVIEIACTK